METKNEMELPSGLTKREYFAGQIIARWNGTRPHRHDTLGGRLPYDQNLKARLDDDAKLAVAAAEALVAALEAGPVQYAVPRDGFEYTYENAIKIKAKAEEELAAMGEFPDSEQAKFLRWQIEQSVDWIGRIEKNRDRKTARHSG